MNLKYVLITSARNEQDFIEKSITSVINQTLLPQKWIIVNDGSTDRTEEVIQKYLNGNKFIELISSKGDAARNFGSKAKAVMFAYDKVRDLDFDLIGNLDADISLPEDYYEQMISLLNSDEKLGLVGGVRHDVFNGKKIKIPSSTSSVCGAIQFFRRECFDKINGYKQLKYGGIDAVAELNIRMIGYKVKSVKHIIISHHRLTGTVEHNLIERRIKHGFKFYSLGYHPLFITLKFLKEILHKPIIIGSITSLLCFYLAPFFRIQRQVSQSEKYFLQKEQVSRLLKRN